MDVVGATTDVRIRRAQTADNDSLSRLFADVSMEADLDLEVRREPDFFGLYRVQGDDWECWVAENDRGVAGMGTILVRDGYLDGCLRRIGYLGDLRLSPELQGKKLLPRFYGPILSEAARRYGCDVFLTTVIASNKRAMRALTGDGARASGIPPYVLIRRFDIRAVHLTVPLPRPRTNIAVRRAGADDVADIAAFLDDDGRRRPFGYAVPERELERRLRVWPDLDPSSFLLAHDRSGDLVGCIALWDPHALKRMVVRGYHGRMRAVHHIYNAAAKILRFCPLPPPGGQLGYGYATHVAVPSDDPGVLRALLHAAYTEQRRTGRTSLAFCVFADDPLAPAFRGFPYTDLSTNLYAVAAPETELPPGCFAAGRPGFEMALV